jgi:putative aminopeptidase FrvX
MNFDRFFHNLQRLADVPGPHGSEELVANLLVEMIGDAADEVWRDSLGNLYALRKGKSERRLLLDAHMDEVGLVVQHIDDNGFLRFDTLGGWDARVLPALDVLVLAEGKGAKPIQGVIGSLPPHMSDPDSRRAAFDLSSLYIDIGLSSAAEAEARGIRVGTPISLMPNFAWLNDKVISGKALDDRLGCAAIVTVLEALKDEQPAETIVASFTVMEEDGTRGASVVPAQVQPDAALIIETTTDGLVPGVDPKAQPSVSGKGPAITVVDKRWTAPMTMVHFLEGVAKTENIPCQRKKPKFGSTNAAALHLGHKGVPCGVIACPCRYIHGPRATARVEDAKNLVRLTLAATRRATEFFDTALAGVKRT